MVASVDTSLQELQCLQKHLVSSQHTTTRFCKRDDIEPFVETFGITRVANQTGLDNIGVPVWSAIRPQSRGLSVATGKGVTDDAAWLSAVFESLEQAFAERAFDLCSMIESPSRMAKLNHLVIPLDRQPRCSASRIQPNDEIAWVRGQSLLSGEEVFAPYDLVGMDMTAEAPWNPDLFLMASNGLAAGGNMAGAVLHGLRELVEDNAFVAAQHFRREKAFSGASCRFDCPPDHYLPKVIQMVERAGLRARFMLPRSGIDVPVIVAALVPRPGDNQPLFSGVACRDKVEDAALGALLEAIQTRLTFIAGSREDLVPQEYRVNLPKEPAGFLEANLKVKSRTSRTDSGDELGRLIEALQNQGIKGIYVFPLGGVAGVFEIVRVLADDLMSVESIPGASMPEAASRRMLNEMLAQ